MGISGIFMFRGLLKIKLDEKGRISVPLKYRTKIKEEFNSMLITTINPDERCLLIYPVPVWEKIEEQLMELPNLNMHVKRLQRLLVGHALDINLDKTGRILIPPALREYAKLEKESVLVGQGKKLELWSDTIWKQQMEIWLNQKTTTEQIPQELEKVII